ncbi:unnamed protein product [Caenorhabditis bovis]|uniref:Solute carrier family 35 member F5 n=1 Tax=Caenorhabditis bovis TaxID=2654633 RepID=A0A8S1FCA0_9PELO|nr:unnamed protein product [Caenorhabditis bovis]
MAPTVTLERVETFSAAHRLNTSNLSKEENAKVFGKCNHVNGHGHNYVWKVKLRGPVDKTTGMVYDLALLKKEMAIVLDTVDHRNLDVDVEFFKERVSTSENVAVYLYEKLKSVMSQPEVLYKHFAYWMTSNIKSEESAKCLDRRTLGICLLLIVNILWVLSSELTRYIFVDEEFRRPFFSVYVKSCTLIIYMVRYLIFEAHDENSYTTLVNDNTSDTESFELSCESLHLEGFETVTEDSDIESYYEGENGKRKRRIRFSDRKEIRRMPSSTAEEQRRARLPYRHPSLECHIHQFPRHIKYTIFIFAPLWMLCSFTYQVALVFTSVSSLNLISSSSSVFVLAFAICFPSSHNRFTLYKCLLVAMNIAGVLLVSHYMPSLLGAFFAQISSVSYAVYLFAFNNFEDQYGKMNINLMFGSIGLLSLIVGTPMLNILDWLQVEKLYPLPNGTQLSSILLSALIGTLIADYLWLLAAGMCDPLTASLSLTVSIPLSFAADTILRNKPPTVSQLIASIPIILAFIGAAYSQNRGQITIRGSNLRISKNGNRREDNEQLIDQDDEL